MVEVATLTRDEYEALVRFLSLFPDEDRSQEYWCNRLYYWWEKNPAFSSEMERGWTLKDQGEIVGFIGSIPLPIQFDGRDTVAFCSTTWRVLPDYRNKSLALLGKLINQAKGTLLFITTPNFFVRQIIPKFGFRLTTMGGYKTNILTNCENAIMSKFNRWGWIPDSVNLRAAKMLNPLLCRHLENMNLGDYEVIELERADVQFDQLWEESKHVYGYTNVRDSRVLNWYCFGNGDFAKRLLGCYKRGKLVGYMIFWVNEFSDSTELECLDFWTHPREDEAIGSMVLGAIEYAHSHRLDSVGLPHYTTILKNCIESLEMASPLLLDRQKFIKVYPLKRKDYFKADMALMDQIIDDSYFVRAQGDVGL